MPPTAQELNEKTSARRSKAAKDQPAHFDPDAQAKKTQSLYAAMVEYADRIMAINQQRKELAEQIKPFTAEVKLILDEGEAMGIDRKAMRDMIALRKKSDGERIRYEASRRQLAKAFGFEDGAQLDLYAADMVKEAESKTKPEPGGELKEGQADAIAAHIAKHGTNEATH